MADEQRKARGGKRIAPEQKGSFKSDLFFWTQALVMALVALTLLSTLVGRVIRVDGSSMVPTLHHNDLLLLQSIGYTPKQGDVVVLHKDFSTVRSPIVKRVIAVGGQHVRIDYSENKVYVDGEALDEPYINEVMQAPDPVSEPMMSVSDVIVPEGSIFVLGDNRNHSTDSRNELLSCVDERYVIGRALFVVFPFSDFGSID